MCRSERHAYEDLCLSRRSAFLVEPKNQSLRSLVIGLLSSAGSQTVVVKPFSSHAGDHVRGPTTAGCSGLACSRNLMIVCRISPMKKGSIFGSWMNPQYSKHQRSESGAFAVGISFLSLFCNGMVCVKSVVN